MALIDRRAWLFEGRGAQRGRDKIRPCDFWYIMEGGGPYFIFSVLFHYFTIILVLEVILSRLLGFSECRHLEEKLTNRSTKSLGWVLTDLTDICLAFPCVLFSHPAP